VALTARRAVVPHLSMQTETEKQSPKQKRTNVILYKMSATTSSVSDENGPQPAAASASGR